jgi:hypothetical protein
VNDEKYIGLDVHQATISVAVMDSKGKVVMESILETKAATILDAHRCAPNPKAKCHQKCHHNFGCRSWRSEIQVSSSRRSRVHSWLVSSMATGRAFTSPYA